MRQVVVQTVWHFLSFDDLSKLQLYQLLLLRSEVFVVEQACVYLDIDGADMAAMHLLGTIDGQLLAYARCLPPGSKFNEPSIGRVITHRNLRGQGAGHRLVQKSVQRLTQHWGAQAIRIDAQAHLEAFYRQHGFLPVSAQYIEDGIPHIEMLRPA